MKRNVFQLSSLIVVGFVFGLFIASMTGPVATAADDPVPTCCEYDWYQGCGPSACNCYEAILQNKPWVQICYSGGHCMPDEWEFYAYCVYD